MSNVNWTKKKFSLSSKYSSSERRIIAHEIIDYIRDRTKAGKGEGNRKWSGAAGRYTKEYMDSQEFRLKSDKSGKVNISLSGDTLDSIEILENKDSGEMAIGIKKSDIDYGKAEGNIRGTYGQKRANPSKARDFMAVTDGEIDKILKRFPLKDKKKLSESLALSKAAFVKAKEITKETEIGE
jgi:hypothetical protein